MFLQTQDALFSSLKREWRSIPFEWGKSDCILSVCDYVLGQTGIDPAAPWRGSYDSEAGAQKIVSYYGGVIHLFDAGMTACGFERCDPYVGAPAVVNVLGTPIAGILGPDRAIVRHDKRGILEMPLPVLGAWNIWH